MTNQDMKLLDCASYDDYLDMFITRNDMRYIRNMRFCRMMVEMGCRSATDIYTPDEYFSRKDAIQESLWPTKRATILFSDSLTSDDPVLRELAIREKANNQKVISSILFVKYRRKSGFEISGYIDFEQSLRRANLQIKGHIDWLGVFQDRVSIRPRPTDLSFYDWHTGLVSYNNSDNYIVMHDIENGLIFMHKGDHKKVCVDITREMYSGNCTRTMLFSDKCGHVVIYDHIIRKKI